MKLLSDENLAARLLRFRADEVRAFVEHAETAFLELG